MANVHRMDISYLLQPSGNHGILSQLRAWYMMLNIGMPAVICTFIEDGYAKVDLCRADADE